MGIEQLMEIYNPLAKEKNPPIYGDDIPPGAGASCGRSLEDGKASEPGSELGLSGAADAPSGPPIRTWQDSGPVCRLSEYLKTNDDQGIRVVLRKGIPALRFEPGLRQGDSQTRWQMVRQAESLFWAAFEDLTYCIKQNLIVLKEG